MSSAPLLVKTNDDRVVPVTKEIARLVEIFKDLLDFTSKEEDPSADSPLSAVNTQSTAEKTSSAEDSPPAASFTCKHVDSETLQLILQWLEHHKADTEVITGIEDKEFRERELPAWDQHFFKDFELDTLQNIIMAANYLNIQNLLFYTAKVIANRMSGMSTREMRAYWNIDWTGEINDLEDGNFTIDVAKEKKEEVENR